MYEVIYTIPRKWMRPAVTIEHDPENVKPWRVCEGDKQYPFLTFRECLSFCFGRKYLPMHEAIDYGASHCAVDISGESL